MAELEQKCSSLAEIERHAAPCQVSHLVPPFRVADASTMPFLIWAYVDDRALTTAAQTAKDAFAKAIEWHIVGKLADVAISDGSSSYSITEFSAMMALAEIAKTIEAALEDNAQTTK